MGTWTFSQVIGFPARAMIFCRRNNDTKVSTKGRSKTKKTMLPLLYHCVTLERETEHMTGHLHHELVLFSFLFSSLQSWIIFSREVKTRMMDLDIVCPCVCLCYVCLVWGPVAAGAWWFLQLVAPGDWSTPPLTAVTSPSQQTGSLQGTVAKTWTSPCGDTDLSTFCKRGS